MNTPSKNSRWLIGAILCFLISWSLYSFFYNPNIHKEKKGFQEKFTALETAQLNFKSDLSKDIEKTSPQSLWQDKKYLNSPFFVFIFKQDSLVFWNNNSINVKQRLNNGYHHYIGHFSNGYYLVDKFKQGAYRIVIASVIKLEYAYQNSALNDHLNPSFGIHNDVVFSWEKKENNFPVVANNGKPLIYLRINTKENVTVPQQLLIFSLYIIGLICLLSAISSIFKRQVAIWKGWIVAYPILLLILSFLAAYFGWIALFRNFELFDPGLFASSRLLPSLGDLIIVVIVICTVVEWFVWAYSQLDNTKKSSVFWGYVGYIVLLFYALFIRHIFQSLIINSSIPLVIDNVFSLTIYSIIVLLIMATLFLSYYFGLRAVCPKIHSTTSLSYKTAVFWLVSGVLFVVYVLTVLNVTVFIALWPVMFNGLFVYWSRNKSVFKTMRYNIVALSLMALFGAVILYINNENNEHQKRELYATQLISDQSPRMEVEYASTMEKLSNNPEFHQLLEEKDFFRGSNFALQIENTCFDDFWERYEMNFFFFLQDGSPLIGYQSSKTQTKKEIDHIIATHTTPSKIAANLYFVDDYYNRLSYIGRHTIYLSDSSTIDFYILFRSKKIPEQIGFPRLLMNEKSYALQYLRNYSIARYSGGKLVMQFGKYNYPTSLNLVHKTIPKNGVFVTKKGINHFVMEQGKKQVVIVSKPVKTVVEQLSTFSYLVLFFGFYILLILFVSRIGKLFRVTSFPLDFRIQTVLIGMVVGVFVIFAWITIQNIKDRYGENTRNKLREKMYAVETDVKQTSGDRQAVFSIKDKDYFSFLVKQLSQTFGTDINFYALSGKLIATSQPKLFQKGISGTQMNSNAYYELVSRKRSEYIHNENFGNLYFYSGYIPFRNNERKVLGFINLQHFSKQNVFKSQLNNFVVAIINLVVFFLVITVVVALIVSRWITSPLRLIQQSIKEIELGKESKRINYTRDDVIGTLVKEYNAKVQELELKAMQLAKSERESAWREMAKQVAHEIKNPLTPMKLSVQHFQRSFDPSDPNAKEKMNRIVQSLIEQIDALTKITNEFSNFAKLPKPNEEKLDLSLLIERIVSIYNGQEQPIQLLFDSKKEHLIFADKDLLIRVFNNLIKNALQAADETRVISIKINVEEMENSYLISIIDNGKGISKEIQSKVFVPNFTTKSTGSGLGLAMVKQIVLNHNGNIWFETEENTGTTFYIKFPKNV